MVKMGFDRNLVNLVMNCVTTVEFSDLINGHLGRRFKPTRGLRQGDPLSPYLFLIVSEVLSLLIRYATRYGICGGNPD
ncbi:hypothetical protein ACFX1R_002592 [Malus domestica]